MGYDIPENHHMSGPTTEPDMVHITEITWLIIGPYDWATKVGKGLKWIYVHPGRPSAVLGFVEGPERNENSLFKVVFHSSTEQSLIDLLRARGFDV